MIFQLFVCFIALLATGTDAVDTDVQETCGWKNEVCTDEQYCATWKRHAWCEAYRKEGEKCTWYKCLEGLDCHEGRCIVSECESNEDCEDPEKCNAGKCENVECVEDGDCGNMFDLGVEGYCLKNVCMEYKTLNEPCSKKERCASELNCRYNKETKESTCVECACNGDCETGLCVDNQCKECLIDNVGIAGVFEHCVAVTKVEKKKNNCVCSSCGSGFLLNKRSTCQACSLEDVQVDVPECVEVGLGFVQRKKEQCICTKCQGEDVTAKAVNGECVSCWKEKFVNCAKVSTEDGCKCSTCARGWTFDDSENPTCSVCDSDKQYYQDGDKCVKCSLKTLFPYRSTTCVGEKRESKTEIVDGTCKCKLCAENWTGDKCDVCAEEDMANCGVCKDIWGNDFVPVSDDAGVESCQSKTYEPPTNCSCVEATDDKDNVVVAECSIHAPLFHAHKAPWCFVDENCQAEDLKESKRFNDAKWAWCE